MQENAKRVSAKLREAGLRVTPQRRAVLAAFHAGESRHLTAEEVFERARRTLPELSRTTVYNALGDLARAGLLRTVEGFGPARYDPNLDPEHQHFYCLSCGRLYDVHVRGVEGLELLDRDEFAVERKSVLFEGYCPGCASRPQRQGRS